MYGGYGIDWKKETAVKVSESRCTMNTTLFTGTFYGWL